MTLISATKCEAGFLLCADTQETVGDYRQPARTIVEMKLAKPQGSLLYAGAGHGVLIDGFETRLRRELERNQTAIGTATEPLVKRLKRN